jgi:hypothetical protein
LGQARTRLQRIKERHPLCCYCGGASYTETIDHVPAKTFFYDKHRPQGLEVPACKRCNNRFGKFDNFFALIAFAQASFLSKKDEHRLDSLISSAMRLFPDATLQFHEGAKRKYMNIKGLFRPAVSISFDHPDIHFTVNYQVARMCAAQYFSFYEKPLPEGTALATVWNSNAQPMGDNQLKQILKALPNYATLKQGSWSAATQFETRFNFCKEPIAGAAAFNFHRCFTGIGFLFTNLEECPQHEEEQLFLITHKGIEPAKGKFPQDLRLP